MKKYQILINSSILLTYCFNNIFSIERIKDDAFNSYFNKNDILLIAKDLFGFHSPFTLIFDTKIDSNTIAIKITEHGNYVYDRINNSVFKIPQNHIGIFMGKEKDDYSVSKAFIVGTPIFNISKFKSLCNEFDLNVLPIVKWETHLF